MYFDRFSFILSEKFFLFLVRKKKTRRNRRKKQCNHETKRWALLNSNPRIVIVMTFIKVTWVYVSREYDLTWVFELFFIFLGFFFFAFVMNDLTLLLLLFRFSLFSLLFFFLQIFYLKLFSLPFVIFFFLQENKGWK